MFWGYICHGLPERCLVRNGEPMPLCARCFGFYFGLLLGMPIGLTISPFVDFDFYSMMGIMVLGVTPMGIDGWTQLKGLRMSNNRLRLVTGLLGGTAITTVWTEVLLRGAGF